MWFSKLQWDLQHCINNRHCNNQIDHFQVKVLWNGTTQYASFCAFTLLPVFYVLNFSDVITSTNTKTQWELWHLHWHTYVLADIFEVRNFRDFRDSFCLFRKCFCSKYITLFWEELSFYLEDKNLFYMIYPNVMHGLSLEILKTFFLQIFYTARF